MGDGSLSQEGIDALLMGKKDTPPQKPTDLLDKAFGSKVQDILKEKPMNDTGILNAVPITLTIILGETIIPFAQLQSIGDGSIVTLDRLAGQDVEIRANNVPIAFGEVLVVDENFGVRVTERISPEKQKEMLTSQSKTVDLKITEIK